MGATREQGEFEELIKKVGGRLRPGRKHMVYLLPGGASVTLSRNPSDKDRAWKNALATLKRVLRHERSRLTEWLLAHLPGGPEVHADELPRIMASLEAQPISFLLELKEARQKKEKQK